MMSGARMVSQLSFRNMKTIKTTIIRAISALSIATIAVLASSCSQDEFQLPESPSVAGEGEINILYEVEGDMPVSRGIAATTQERRLDDVYILFFEHNKDADTGLESDSYICYTQASASEGKSTLSFDPPAYLKNSQQYRLLVVGNGDKYKIGNTSTYAGYLASFKQGSGYTEVKGKLLAERTDPVTSSSPGVLPLCGSFVKQTTGQEIYFTFNRTTEGVVVDEDCIFKFKRAICRIDIHNLVGGVLDIRYARLVNTRTQGAFFIDGLDPGQQPAPIFKPDAQSPGFVEMPEEFHKMGLQRLESTLYCFPNTVNTSLPDDGRTSAIMMAGYYIDPANGVKDENLTYYRFNITNTGDGQALQRNYCYRATIKGVTRRGEDSEEKAYNAKSPVFSYDIDEDWDTSDDNAVSDSEGNFLVVSKSLLTFTGDQCGADVIKLTVNTNPEVTWDIEMDKESAEWFQFKKIQEGQGERIKAFTCGPTQTNYTDYYRDGKLTIVATNTKSGKVLRKEVRLLQLTTKGDVKCLIVNDYTTDFKQEVSQYGQTISFKVITGSPTNKWEAKDEDNALNGWTDSNVAFTEGGTNGNYFTMTFPANIDKKRSVEITFRFVSDDPEVQNTIKPIKVLFTQDVCDQTLSIEGWPADGSLTLNCFDPTTGWQTANCVAQARKFTVHLQKPDEHYFTVTSSFDKYRDLTLSENDGRYGFGNEVRSIHPALYSIEAHYTNSSTDTPNEKLYSNLMSKKTSDHPSFFINAFRMGPGDVTIEGKITVQVKDKASNEDIPNGKLELTVKLVVPSDEYMLNDVIIKNDMINLNQSIQDNGWIYIMDRNMGCEARMHKDESNTYPNKAMWCFLEQSGKTDPWIITNMPNKQEWLGDLRFPLKGSNSTGASAADYKAWKNELKDRHGHLGRMYENADTYPWMPMSIYSLPSIRKNTAVSKGRHFILTDEELCPTNSNNKKIRIACWLPSGYEVGYGFVKSYSSTFGSTLAVMVNKSTLSFADFEAGNSYGYCDHGNSISKAHLVRLMYLIGYTAKSIPGYTLTTDKIDEELEYYKNHILKCYEQQ